MVREEQLRNNFPASVVHGLTELLVHPQSENPSPHDFLKRRAAADQLTRLLNNAATPPVLLAETVDALELCIDLKGQYGPQQAASLDALSRLGEKGASALGRLLERCYFVSPDTASVYRTVVDPQTLQDIARSLANIGETAHPVLDAWVNRTDPVAQVCFERVIDAAIAPHPTLSACGMTLLHRGLLTQSVDVLILGADAVCLASPSDAVLDIVSSIVRTSWETPQLAARAQAAALRMLLSCNPARASQSAEIAANLLGLSDDSRFAVGVAEEVQALACLVVGHIGMAGERVQRGVRATMTESSPLLRAAAEWAAERLEHRRPTISYETLTRCCTEESESFFKPLKRSFLSGPISNFVRPGLDQVTLPSSVARFPVLRETARFVLCALHSDGPIEYSPFEIAQIFTAVPADLPKNVEALAGIVRTSTTPAAVRASQVLGTIGLESWGALKSLATDERPLIRAHAFYGIGTMVFPPSEALEIIKAGLRDPSLGVKRAAVRASWALSEPDRKQALEYAQLQFQRLRLLGDLYSALSGRMRHFWSRASDTPERFVDTVVEIVRLLRRPERALRRPEDDEIKSLFPARA